MATRLWIAMSLMVAACGDDTTPSVEPLPVEPHVYANALGGVYTFPLITAGQSKQETLTFSNGGQNDLVFSDVHLDPNTAPWTLGAVVPASLRVETGGALGAPITFAPALRGVYLTRLSVTSNAVNYPSLEIAIIGPAPSDPPSVLPDIEVFEATVELAPRPDLAFEVAVIRYINLGEESLTVSGYTIADTTNFRFLTGTAVPGAPCDPAGVCSPAGAQTQGCCGNLTCDNGACSDLTVGYGEAVIFGVRLTQSAGGATGLTTTVDILSNAAGSPTPVSITDAL